MDLWEMGLSWKEWVTGSESLKRYLGPVHFLLFLPSRLLPGSEQPLDTPLASMILCLTTGPHKCQSWAETYESRSPAASSWLFLCVTVMAV